MTIWMPNLSERSGPKYLAIANAIADDIAGGALPPGAKLPPQRNLAYDLGITLGTVTRAYAEAERRGLIGGEVGRGTFVLAAKSGARPDGFISLGPEQPGEINFAHATPVRGRAGRYLAKALRSISDDPGIDLLANYQMNTGLPAHLQAGARWVAQAGVDASAERIALTNGAQHGILTTLMALTQPGDTVLAESLTYPGFIQIANQLGLKLEPVEMDDDGIRPDALEETQRRTSAQLLYTMPAVHNPTATAMPLDRLQAVAATVRRLRIGVLEDEVWSGLSERATPPLAALAPERTVYVTSLSKTMAGGLRVGYVLAPEEWIGRIRSNVRLSGWMTAPLMAEIASRWIEDGTGRELARWQSGAASKRFQIAGKHLADYDPKYHPAGHYVWLELPEPWRAGDFKAEAQARGVIVLSGDTFAVGRTPAPHAVRLGIGNPDTDDEVAGGVAILADILKRGPGGAPAAV